MGWVGDLQGQAGTTPCSWQWARQARGSGWWRWPGAPWRGCGLRAGDGHDPRQGVTEGAGVGRGCRGGGRRPPRSAAQAGAAGHQVALLPVARGCRWPGPRAPSQTTARSLGGAPRAARCLNGGKKSFEAVFSHRAHMSSCLFMCWFLWGRRAAVSALGKGASGGLRGIKCFAEPGRSGGLKKPLGVGSHRCHGVCPGAADGLFEI